ncbi:MAG: type II toxin-antitoxin system VapC family toxin [Candidatus Binatia bacterium]
MIVYVDSSVLLRIILGEPAPLRQWRAITRPIASELIRLECLRTIDRARLQYRLDDRHVAAQRAAVLEQLEAFETIPIDSAVLDRAAEPFPTRIGSLDAIHLASALMARAFVPGLQFATHDSGLAVAAQAMGFKVFGVPARRGPARKA